MATGSHRQNNKAAQGAWQAGSGAARTDQHEAGALRHAEVALRRGQLMAHVLGSFAPAERTALADLLERLIRAVDDFVGEVSRRPATDEPPK